MDAARACLLSGSVFISDLAEADVLSEGLTNISDGDFAVFKYLMFDGREASFRVKTSFSKGGVIEIRLDRPDGIKIGECRLPGFVPEMPFAITDCKINRITSYNVCYTKLLRMVYRDKNRAGIVVWSVANETKPSQYRDKVLTELVELTHRLDATRLVGAAFDNLTYKTTENIV